jgi:hypothetical protein
MYGVERSVVRFVRDVGTVEGTVRLAVKGSVGVTRLGTVAFVPVPGIAGALALSGRSHDVCCLSVVPCHASK